MQWAMSRAGISTRQCRWALALAGRFSWRELPLYWLAQLAGAVLAAAMLLAVASGKAGWSPGGFASNGFADLSPGGYSITAALLVEVILTAGFLLVVLGSTSARAPQGFAPIAIGLALTLIHLVSIPVTNTSVNPARSTGVRTVRRNGRPQPTLAIWLAPLAGAAIGAIIWRLMLAADEAG